MTYPSKTYSRREPLYSWWPLTGKMLGSTKISNFSTFPVSRRAPAATIRTCCTDAVGLSGKIFTARNRARPQRGRPFLRLLSVNRRIAAATSMSSAFAVRYWSSRVRNLMRCWQNISSKLTWKGGSFRNTYNLWTRRTVTGSQHLQGRYRCGKIISVTVFPLRLLFPLTCRLGATRPTNKKAKQVQSNMCTSMGPSSLKRYHGGRQFNILTDGWILLWALLC